MTDGVVCTRGIPTMAMAGRAHAVCSCGVTAWVLHGAGPCLFLAGPRVSDMEDLGRTWPA